MDDKQVKNKDNEPLALDDTQRVKVMSPGMMVYKRFIRNRLAIIGIVILVSMFLFSFVGGFLYPYSEAQVFKGTGMVDLDYAIATYNTELHLYMADGVSMSASVRSRFLRALAQGDESFMSENVEYIILNEGGDFFRIGANVPLAEADILRGRATFKPSEQLDVSPEMNAAFIEAYNEGAEEFTFNGETYRILYGTRWGAIAAYQDFAVASRRAIDAYSASDAAVVQSYGFRLAAEDALFLEQETFEYNGETYRFEMMDEDNGTVYDASGAPFAEISIIIVIPPPDNPIFLPVPFINDIRDAIVHHKIFFNTDTATGQMARYDIHNVNQTFSIKTATATEVILIHNPPSAEHPLGTDANGMDMLARLMYGGRVSLTVGFVVIIIETLLGVVIGGVSGYFGGWVDTLIMRFVDLFNTIPQFPMLIILGAMLDAFRVEPMIRIYILMLILGLLGWTGVARTVRGQILSLREQDFMVAAEASGLSIPRRIFRHLVPNVMPLLIVNATMGLGGIILTEATLSFLGLGVKYPLASWGSIANAATSVTVMNYFPWTWIPAGVLIFTTVLGFNFVGDGLRDAFDPKMKR